MRPQGRKVASFDSDTLPHCGLQYSCFKKFLVVQGFPDSSVGKESACNAGDSGSIPGLGRSVEKGWLPTQVFLGFLHGSAGKEFACNTGDSGSIPGLGRSPGEGIGYPFQYSGLKDYTDCKVHGVTKSQTPLSSLHFQFHHSTRTWYNKQIKGLICR